MGFIIDSGRVSTEARRESFYINLPDEVTVYTNDGAKRGGSLEMNYEDLPHLVKALSALADYMQRERIYPAWHGKETITSQIVGRSHFEPEQNAHQFTLAGFVMEPEYEFVDGVVA